MIEARGLTKRYGSTVAVDDLSFTVPPGRVTGFLGPNGSGKSTTMRLLLQLDRPNAGTATFNGRAYRTIAHPATGRRATSVRPTMARTSSTRRRRIPLAAATAHKWFRALRDGWA